MARKKRYFLPYELDAFANAPNIARSCGASPADVVYGNLLMWQQVWRTKSDVVTTAHIRAFFGVDACEALVLFGHLEATPAGWRVKGAAEWLRVMTAQSEAGKAHSGNLQKGRQDLSGSSPASAPKRPEAGDKPVGSSPALPATSDQRPATSSKGSAAKKTAADQPRPKALRFALESDYLDARGEAYKHQGAKDTDALASLLPLASDEEIRSRWRKALDLGTVWPGCSTFAQLGSKWNDLAAPDGPKKERFERFDPNDGIVRHLAHQCARPDCPECGPVLAAVAS